MLTEYPALGPNAGHVRPVMYSVRLPARIAAATLIAIAVDGAVPGVIV